MKSIMMYIKYKTKSENKKHLENIRYGLYFNLITGTWIKKSHLVYVSMT